MKITGASSSDCNIKRIYKLIGKQPFTVTNLKDLKDAAQELGLSATGYKLTVSELKKNVRLCHTACGKRNRNGQ